MTDLARLLRVHRNTLHKFPYGMKAHLRMGEVVEILRIVEVMCWKGAETPGLMRLELYLLNRKLPTLRALIAQNFTPKKF